MDDFLSILLFFSMCSVLGDTSSISVVKTDSGTIKGRSIKFGGEDVTEFLGVPYAEPPLGELRFQRPYPVKRWSFIRDATQKPPPCMQYSSRKIIWFATSEPDEDCLYLNIWVPGKLFHRPRNILQKLPVLFWIHGGGFMGGSSEMDVFDGAILSSLSESIIVTINYRLGSFGFLNSFTDLAAGNMGLYDQNLALQWVKNNIKYFGGDSDAITLAGQSIGGVSVGFHLISPMSKGLFRRAIIMSNSPYHPGFVETRESAQFKSDIVARTLGCADDQDNFYTNPIGMVECLKTKDAFQISVAEDLIAQNVTYFFLASVGDKILPIHPITAMDSNQFSDKDLLIGHTKNEGTYYLYIYKPEVFNLTSEPNPDVETAKQVIQLFFEDNTYISPQIVSEYYLNNLNNYDPKKITETAATAISDSLSSCPDLFFAEKMSNVYFYEITHRRDKETMAKWLGSLHCSELPFLFGVPFRDTQNYTCRERTFSKTLIDDFMSFAKFGNPVSSSTPEIWPKFKPTTSLIKDIYVNTYDINKHPRLDACNFFWRPHYRA